MKPIIKILYLIPLVVLNFSCATTRQQEPNYSQDGSVDFQLFYDQLSPYGQWVDYSNYGYVWIPDVRREFAPYSTNGHWVMTDYGWTWISDYRWGWAPFHYGRWDYDDYYGWFWVPDDQWGPAWVTWRAGNGYYGWAPMRPGMDIHDRFYDRYPNRWNFVRETDFGKRDLHRYYINRGNYGSILDKSTVIDNTYQDRRRNATYVTGPSADNVQRATGKIVERVRVRDNERPGQKLNNDELSIYRPIVQSSAGKRPAPTKVTDIQEVKPVRERGSGTQRNTVSPTINTNDQQREPRQTVERRRSERRQTIEKTQPINQAQPAQQQTDRMIENNRRISERQNQEKQQPGQSQAERQQEYERNNIERQRKLERQNQTRQQQQPASPVSVQEERREIQQEQKEKQDQTKQEIQIRQQQQQVEKQQQKIARQQQQMDRQQQIERRRQERQAVRQQQTEKSQQIPQTQPTQQQEQKEQQRTINPPSENRRR